VASEACRGIMTLCRSSFMPNGRKSAVSVSKHRGHRPSEFPSFAASAITISGQQTDCGAHDSSVKRSSGSVICRKKPENLSANWAEGKPRGQRPAKSSCNRVRPGSGIRLIEEDGGVPECAVSERAVGSWRGTVGTQPGQGCPPWVSVRIADRSVVSNVTPLCRERRKGGVVRKSVFLRKIGRVRILQHDLLKSVYILESRLLTHSTGARRRP
jgi:hypothetical protein